MEQPAAAKEEWSPGLNNAFLFALFNALSFQIVLNNPMVLFAKSLGASATVLGIIAGMMPLLVIFQIPAASYIPRIGYKRFVYAGWGTRVMFIYGVAFVPLLGYFLNTTTQVVVLLFLLFGFNLSRGISSCAWLPWITSLVPADIRGKYLARDAMVVNFGSFLAYLLAGLALGKRPEPWQFAAIFAFSAVMGMTSLVFLKRIPDSPIPEEARASKMPVPWLEISRYEPFRKLLRMNVAWALAYGGINAFTVAFLRTQQSMTDGLILLISSTAFLGGIGSMWLGNRMDKFGSKPVFGATLLSWLVVMTGWVLLAGGVIVAELWLVLTLHLFMGLGAALVNMANTRLAMLIIPPMGRNHFFALFSVVGNLTLGLSPIFWGLLIDVFAAMQMQVGAFELNKYSLFFCGSGLAFLATFYLARRLEEPAAVSLESLLREILIQSPQRMFWRLWPRG